MDLQGYPPMLTNLFPQTRAFIPGFTGKAGGLPGSYGRHYPNVLPGLATSFFSAGGLSTVMQFLLMGDL
jgi:hypothetical protein